MGADHTDTCSGAADSQTTARSLQGPVWTLCEEIGFDFDRRLERFDVFMAFVRELVAEVEETREIASQISQMGIKARRSAGQQPSEGSAQVLRLCQAMLAATTERAAQTHAGLVHEACDRLNPEDAYPTDHLIDMLSSCASAVRFGLEKPCRSRHAADAASHIWKHKYGVALFDRNTGSWEKDWTRKVFTRALVSLIPDVAQRSERALTPDTPGSDLPNPQQREAGQ